MKRALLIAAVLVANAGCTSLPGRIGEASRLSQATEQLRSGKETEARKALTTLATTKTPGVTDEALFRLALLQLKDESEYPRARQSLERLQKEFPASEWTPHAAALLSIISEARSADDLRRQLKTLKDTNYSLSRENRELRLNIDKLKSLDIELEKKVR